ncbi:hypothetical protein FHT39_000322 [Mitsuaria sp. BK045]|uniref:hypothetical protein n=1 Tax=unclassified Roseateles TaxID=2626991 RepID=UPI001609B139|nr:MULTISPECIES: hypothetical protein [unclassified Roseateles]MBB3291683.1 hypothetical protein [Mitsuaria sp. BK041]MBB3360900.1 hypothetical protein [Mitsuaria sp. BK045]
MKQSNQSTRCERVKHGGEKVTWDATTMATVASAVFAGLSAIFAAVSAILSARTIKVQQQTQASQAILQQAELSLQWAWEALTEQGKHVDPPLADRLNWLTAARHIERYKQLKLAITDSAHKTICEEREEFWRHRFYLSLPAKTYLQPGYLRTQTPMQNGLEKTSVAVVFAFSSWPESKQDPIADVHVQNLLEGSKVLNGKPGLRAFIETTGRTA